MRGIGDHIDFHFSGSPLICFRGLFRVLAENGREWVAASQRMWQFENLRPNRPAAAPCQRECDSMGVPERN
jgi:hypothetical protein